MIDFSVGQKRNLQCFAQKKRHNAGTDHIKKIIAAELALFFIQHGFIKNMNAFGGHFIQNPGVDFGKQVLGRAEFPVNQA